MKKTLKIFAIIVMAIVVVCATTQLSFAAIDFNSVVWF